MPRMMGVDIPGKKHIRFALRYIHGIGPKRADDVLAAVNVDPMKKADDVQAVVEGVELIQKKFMGILEKQGVKPIETKEADFDVEIHEAVAQFPAPTPEMKNKVVDCTLKGYKLNEKVIRHAQVVVGI